MKQNYKIIIGLEIHVQLKTKSKMFCSCSNQAENKAPNTLVCPVCMGLPGTLPVPNQKAIEWAIKAGLALECAINQTSKFDRKNYFYPDLPKGYQISQYDLPIGEKGMFEFYSQKDSKEKSVRIRRVHIEEDAGKLMHQGKDSLVDYNRAGTPLLEIVTEPDLCDPQDTKIFLQDLRQLMRHLDISFADMEKGHLRCDANINLIFGENQATPIAEIKNLNSFKSVESALIYEAKRQFDEFSKNNNIFSKGAKTTRSWDEKAGVTKLLRSKEEEADYRYFPEPDIPNLKFDDEFLEQIKSSLPSTPKENLTWAVEVLKINIKDAKALLSDLKNFEHFKRTIELGADPQKTARLILNKYANFKSRYKIYDFEEFGIKPEYTKSASTLLSRFNNQIENSVVEEMFKTKADPEYIIKEQDYKTTNEKDTKEIISSVINENKDAVSDFKQGKGQALGFLVGAVMKKTRGQVDPKTVQKILKELLK